MSVPANTSSTTPAFSTPGFDALAELVVQRRTNLRIDRHRPVDSALLERLCGLGTWAPNHKRTEPWRFAVVTGASRRTLGELTAAHLAATGTTEEAVLEKTRGKYERAATVLLVASHSAPDAGPSRRAEDRDAVAAGVQNILLGATAAGLNSYWGTGAVTDVPAVKQWCGLEAEDTIVAVIYLGWPIGDVPDPGRSDPVIVHHS
jgi:nitroreductase